MSEFQFTGKRHSTIMSLNAIGKDEIQIMQGSQAGHKDPRYLPSQTDGLELMMLEVCYRRRRYSTSLGGLLSSPNSKTSFYLRLFNSRLAADQLL